MDASEYGFSKCTDPAISAKGNPSIEDITHDDKTSGNQKSVTDAAFGSHFESSDQQNRLGHGVKDGEELSLFGNGQDDASVDDAPHNAEGHGMTSKDSSSEMSHGNAGTSHGEHSMLNGGKEQAGILGNTNAPDFCDTSSNSGESISSPS